MIFVSGTKRSGTSMWMQVLAAAGLPVLGKAFPRNWEKTIKDANPGGFYESILRMGVYWRTNPHPQTGDYFLPEHVAGYAVKVFVPGVIRSERSYIENLVANVRHWREYATSIERLYAMEEENRPTQEGAEERKAYRFPPALEWWMENFALVRDLSIRKYPARLQSYDEVLDNPQGVVERVLTWIGQGDVEAAVAAVKPERRTQTDRGEDTVEVEPELAQVFDDLYAAVAARKGFSKALLETLNATNRKLLPRLVEEQTKVAQSAPRARPEPVAGLPKLG